MSEEMERVVLETAFEPDGENYLFYYGRWSYGIPVTEAERQAYITSNSFIARRDWVRNVRRRQSTAPRRSPHGRNLRLRAATPLVLTVFGFCLGAFLIFAGVAGNPALWWRILLIGGGAYLIASSGANIAARWRLRNGK